MKARAAASYAQGVAAFNAGDFAAAERIFKAIVAQHPRAHEVWNALCLVALRAAAPDIAADRARCALELDRTNVDYLNNLGIACGELGQFDAAEDAFRRALEIKPTYVEAHYNLGKVLHKQGKLIESLKEYQRAYAIDPKPARTQLGLAQMYQVHGQPERALRVLRAAGAAENPHVLIQAYMECLADIEGPEAALFWLRGLLAPDPERRITLGPLAQILLSLGQWREGWKYHSLYWRACREPGHVPSFAPLPSRLDGKQILLGADQGLGDILFFLRFAAELHARGASIFLECPPRLRALLTDREIVTLVAEDAAEEGSWDERIWLSDLPALLELEATPPAFGLRVEEALRLRTRDHLARLGPPPYLGLTWRAGIDVLRNREFGANRDVISKEVPPQLLGHAIRGFPGTLVSLQRGPTAAELDAIRGAAAAPVHDLSPANDDLREVLAVLAELNEYVAVSNTNIHLLAGLRRAARVLVPHPPEWRWMRRDGPSDWFPDFPVYRQSHTRDWTEPLAHLRNDLIG
jgi:Flp pilus assembly protein TadD